jgi:succinate dehydrogenase / fumarate reductase, cytochrome b subunit
MTTPLHEKAFPSDERVKLPRPFILRRMHSLLGVWLVIYLFEHLLVNSQMALYLEDDGSGFVRMVNSIHSIPFLQAVELIFLGLPFLIHGLWGIKYALTSKSNSFRSSGTNPSLPQYKRNRAFTWQRVTSWLLLVGIIAHVVHMRFIEYPEKIYRGDQVNYFVSLDFNPGLPLVAQKLNVQLYDNAQLLEREEGLEKEKKILEELKPNGETYEADVLYSKFMSEVEEEEEWVKAAKKKPIKKDQVLAVAPSAGGAFFLIVRQAFLSPALVILYSILVVSAVYHAFNGLWTFMITWGITLTRRSQKTMRAITTILMAIVMFLGLMSAWGTYWTNIVLK